MLSQYEQDELIKAAVFAPSADNSQPFKYYWSSSSSLELWIDESRSGKASDNRFVLSDIALGAAIENIVIRASSLKLASDIQYFPSIEELPHFVATITFDNVTTQKDDDLANAIPTRTTDRRFPFKGVISNTIQKELQMAAQKNHSDLVWFNGKHEIKKVLPIIQQAESIRFQSKILHQELFSSVNFDDETIDEGMHISVLAIEKIAQPIFKQLKKWSVMNWMNKIGGYAMIGIRSVQIPISFSPALALITINTNTRVDVVKGGRAIQRVWLQATVNELSVHPYAAPGVFSLGFISCEEEQNKAIKIVQKKMKKIIVGDGFGLMFLRIGYNKRPLSSRTRRRSFRSFSKE
ncbi:MAG: hypothetical protein JKX76_06880 [Colwellia sp.]|nr:hypothetical protein [Colwellia sp.]